jgi:hypothetical protein
LKERYKGGREVTGRQGRRRRKLLDNLKERRGYSHLKEEALDHTMWRARFGRGFGPVVRQTAKWMTYDQNYYTNASKFKTSSTVKMTEIVYIGVPFVLKGRRRSAAALLLGRRVRIQPGARMFVRVVCRTISGLCSGLITRPG